MGVSSGSPVSAGNTNNAFLDANADDAALGKISFENTDPASGANVENIQENVNSLNHFTGRSSNVNKDALPAWSSNDAGVSTDNLYERADALTLKFNASSGHTHTGGAGDAPPIDAFYIANVKLKGSVVRGVDVTGAVGGSSDVSSQFVAAIPSNGPVIKGIVVNTPYNQVILRDLFGDKIVNGSGDEVYGRLTESSGTWTLTYYVNLSGTETAYSFGSATNLSWYYQQLFNPIFDAPVYSEYAVTPSENTTSDVVDASETQAGKVLLANSAPPAVASASAKGTSARVAHMDHTHEGVHSIFKTGDSQVVGDVELSPGAGITITRVGNKFTIDGTTAAVGYQEVPGGPVNGVNDTFGPLSQTPASAESIIVFVDGLPVDKSKWGLSTLSIVFTSGNEPLPGQDVYVWYIGSGVPIIPPTPTGTLKTEFRTITNTEAVNKKIVLVSTPATPAEILVDVIGGGAQVFNVDYTVVGNEFRWNGYALDGILSQSDVIRFHYIT